MKPAASALSIDAAQPCAARPRAAASAPPKPGAPVRWRRLLALIGVGLAGCGVVALIDVRHGAHLHAPRLALFGRVPLIVQLHVTAAVLALAIGTALLIGVKGAGFHKVAGWVWVACMMTVAISSFWIRTSGHFSYIHFLSGWTSIAVPMGVAAIKRRDVKRHRTMMTNTFMGGLILAGAFTFTPGRLMWHVFVG